jgi:hypothetical protein
VREYFTPPGCMKHVEWVGVGGMGGMGEHCLLRARVSTAYLGVLTAPPLLHSSFHSSPSLLFSLLSPPSSPLTPLSPAPLPSLLSPHSSLTCSSPLPPLPSLLSHLSMPLHFFKNGRTHRIGRSCSSYPYQYIDPLANSSRTSCHPGRWNCGAGT